MDAEGHITSHLTGLVYRSTRLMHDYNMELVFVFDGKPPPLKQIEINRRREARMRAEREWKEAYDAGDYKKAFSKATRTGRLTKEMIEDSKKTLQLLGIPFVQAPGEAEAQAAELVKNGEAWASNSRDYDSLLFGTPRLVRYLTISGQEFLPSRKLSRRLRPEIINLQEFLDANGIDRHQLVDLAIMMGTDFNRGIRGIGPKRGLSLIKRYGTLDNMPDDVQTRLPPELEEIRSIFLRPETTHNYDVSQKPAQEETLYEFLCEERGFSKERLLLALERMRGYHLAKEQRSLKDWVAKGKAEK